MPPQRAAAGTSRPHTRHRSRAPPPCRPRPPGPGHRVRGEAGAGEHDDPLQRAQAGDRHDPRDDRRLAPGGRHPVTEPQVVLDVEEHLGDREVSPRAALADEVLGIGVEIRGPRMPFRKCPDAQAEVARGLDQPDQVRRVLQALRMRDPLGIGVAWRIPAEGQHVTDAHGSVGADHAPQFGHGMVNCRQVPHRGERRLRGDPPGNPDGPVPRRAARPIGDGDEGGTERLQFPDRPPQTAFRVRRLGRHELERKGLTARGQQITDGGCTVQDPGWHAPRLVGRRRIVAARRADGHPRGQLSTGLPRRRRRTAPGRPGRTVTTSSDWWCYIADYE